MVLMIWSGMLLSAEDLAAPIHRGWPGYNERGIGRDDIYSSCRMLSTYIPRVTGILSLVMKGGSAESSTKGARTFMTLSMLRTGQS